jgi:hypothetical protein
LFDRKSFDPFPFSNTGREHPYSGARELTGKAEFHVKIRKIWRDAAVESLGSGVDETFGMVLRPFGLCIVHCLLPRQHAIFCSHPVISGWFDFAMVFAFRPTRQHVGWEWFVHHGQVWDVSLSLSLTLSNPSSSRYAAMHVSHLNLAAAVN